MSRPGRPQGGAKSEAGKAAYWRMQYESAIGALADLIAEHTETVESIRELRAKVEKLNAEDHVDVRHPQRCPACVKDEVLTLIDEVLK